MRLGFYLFILIVFILIGIKEFTAPSGTVGSLINSALPISII